MVDEDAVIIDKQKGFSSTDWQYYGWYFCKELKNFSLVLFLSLLLVLSVHSLCIATESVSCPTHDLANW